MITIHEPAREIPVAYECDLCVVGGSCTGVFAAVRAARLGLSVVLVEQNILLGGMAVAAQVNEWHSLDDATGTKKIIGGLTAEVIERLDQRNAVRRLQRDRGPYILFNSAELAFELDRLVCDHGIRLLLKSPCVSAVREGNRITAAIVEDKSGRRAIQARMFIDASGDGDLLRRAGFQAWKNPILQPVSYQMLAAGFKQIQESTGKSIWKQVQHRSAEFGFSPDYPAPWINDAAIPADLVNVYGPRLNGVDATDADQVTKAVLESRRLHRALLDMVRSELSPNVSTASFAHGLGIRETWHVRSLHQLTVSELLSGVPFPDAIASGTYPVDVHSPEGTLLRYMDGREEVISQGGAVSWRRWCEASDENPLFYQIPYRCLVPEQSENLLVAGRLLDADREAYGGVRVMVNMNQTGEAAGTAAWLALQTGRQVAEIDTRELVKTLQAGGSLICGQKG